MPLPLMTVPNSIGGTIKIVVSILGFGVTISVKEEVKEDSKHGMSPFA